MSLHALGAAMRNLQLNYVAFKDLWNENQSLKEQVAALEAERNRLFEAKLANDRLTELLEIRTRILRESVAATVISNSPSSWFRTITVDKGTLAGIHQGMAVITPKGVVGKVVSVEQDNAKVMLLTDHKSGLDIITQRTRVRGIVSGSVDGEPIVKYMGLNEDVRPGDRLITSGLDGTFPKGLLVGTIVNIADDGPGLFRRVRVALAVDPLVMEEVLFISDKPRPAVSSASRPDGEKTPSVTP
jgi:rod shape-determining protein MreC